MFHSCRQFLVPENLEGLMAINSLKKCLAVGIGLLSKDIWEARAGKKLTLMLSNFVPYVSVIYLKNKHIIKYTESL